MLSCLSHKMASWTLWQPLIPRYQLTAKEMAVEVVQPRPKSSPASPRSGRVTVTGNSTLYLCPQTGKQGSSYGYRKTRTAHCEVDVNASADGGMGSEVGRRGKGTMYFTMASAIDTRGVSHSAGVKTAFPRRRSSYVDNYKQQQRINTTRQNLEDPSTASPRRGTPSPRHASPAKLSMFPVTRMEIQEECKQNRTRTSQTRDIPRAKTAAPRITPRSTTTVAPPPKRLSCKSAGPSRNHRVLAVNTIHPFDPSPKPFVKNPLYKESGSPRRYAVRKLDDATMFIDDDKIIFIKKKTTKNDVLLSQSAVEDPNYIKHLRKLYLSEPRDLAKFMKAPVVEKKNVIRERLEYDLKTDHILNYYSRADDRHDADVWATVVEESRKSKTPCTTPRSAGAVRRVDLARVKIDSAGRIDSPRRRQCSNKATPPQSARSAEDKRPYSARSSGPSDNVHMNHDSLSDWNVFLKLNSQSRLHERRFYLQTPMMRLTDSFAAGNQENPPCDNHECHLCRLEMEMIQNDVSGKSAAEGSKITDPNTESKPVRNGTGSNKTKVKNQQVKRLQKNVTDKVDGEETKKEESTRCDSKPELCTISTSTADDAIAMTPDIDSPGESNSVSRTINVNLQLPLQSDSQETMDRDGGGTDAVADGDTGNGRGSESPAYHLRDGVKVGHDELRGTDSYPPDKRGDL